MASLVCVTVAVALLAPASANNIKVTGYAGAKCDGEMLYEREHGCGEKSSMSCNYGKEEVEYYIKQSCNSTHYWDAYFADEDCTVPLPLEGATCGPDRIDYNPIFQASCEISGGTHSQSMQCFDDDGDAVWPQWEEKRSRCDRFALPDYLKHNFSTFPQDHLATYHFTPVITLYAPCYLTVFAELAHEFHASAAEWRYVQTETEERVEVRHWREEPIVVQRGLSNVVMLTAAIAEASLPVVGRFDESSYKFYEGNPVVLGLFDPTRDADAVDEEYRPLLTSLVKANPRYSVLYMDTRNHRSWISQELKIRTFPTIAIFDPFPSAPVLYQGDMTTEHISRLIRDSELQDAEIVTMGRLPGLTGPSPPHADLEGVQIGI